MDSATARAEINKFTSGRKSLNDYGTDYSKELGVDQAQSRNNDILSLIRNTEGVLKGVPDSVSGRTQGSLVNEAQRQRLVGLESAPLTQSLDTLGRNYSDSQTNYRDLVSRAQTKAGNAYQSDADRLSSLEGEYNKAMTSEDIARRQAAEDAAARRAQAAQDAYYASLNTGNGDTGANQGTIPGQPEGTLDDVFGTGSAAPTAGGGPNYANIYKAAAKNVLIPGYLGGTIGKTIANNKANISTALNNKQAIASNAFNKFKSFLGGIYR